jgi:ABC-type phosphate/phosphonate transport system substrate-binding protein
MIRRSRFWLLSAMAVAALWCGWEAAAPAARAQTATPARQVRLHVLASRSAVGAVNFADFQLAGTIWVQSIGRRRGFQVDSRFEVAPNLETVSRQIEDFSADLVILDVVEYIKLAPSGLLRPFVGIARGKMGIRQSYHLLVNRDSGYAGIEDLRGKNVLAYFRSDAEMGKMWTESLLNERRLGRAERFFASLTRVSKASAACLPVFFGKADACIVDSPSWDVLTEMNPQLASRLRIAATSPPYVEGLVCLHAKHKDFVEELLQGLVELHKDPEGKQLLMIFKGERTDEVREPDLATARDLWAKYTSFAGLPSLAARPEGIQAARRP